MTTRTTTAIAAGLREYARTPVLLALVVFLPAYVILVFTTVLPSASFPVDLPGVGRVTVDTTSLYGVLLVPLVAGLLGGVAGLFSVQAARDADARLVVAGYRPWQVAVARFGVLAVAAVAVTGVSLAVLAPTFVPDSVAVFAAATVLAALVYGLLGALVGLVVDRLPGVYLMLFAPMIDVFLYQNPTVADRAAVATYLPAHWPVRLAVDAAFSSSVDLAALGWSVAAVCAVGVAATAAVYRSLTA